MKKTFYANCMITNCIEVSTEGHTLSCNELILDFIAIFTHLFQSFRQKNQLIVVLLDSKRLHG